MSLKTALINLAGSVGKCQENARSLKQCLEMGLVEASGSVIDPYTLVKKETGAVAINIPEGASELIVIVDVSNHSTIVNIPTAILGETEISFYAGGYASASNCMETIVKASSSKVTLNTAYFNGTSYITTATCAVYYK